MAMTSRHSGALRLVQPVEIDDGYVDELARKAAALASHGERSQALTCYREALLLDDARAELWFSYANLQRDLGLRDDAAESFEFALRISPGLFAARYSLAKLLFELGRPLAARAHYREVIAQQPGYVPAWRNLARLHHAMGEFDAAEACLREAMSRAPQDTELAPLLAEVLRDRQDARQN